MPQFTSVNSDRGVNVGAYARFGKRACDLFFSIVMMVLLLPLLVLVGILLKLTSKGPILFHQLRVGRDGQLFQIKKFRSMRAEAGELGPTITKAGDRRITPLGRLLRKTKVDELPQFWNVLKGDMSIVGPRPEVPKYVELYTPEQLRVLSVRPGITDPASVAYRHEEALLEEQQDAERFYIETLLPHKLVINLKYLEEMSFLYDLRIVAATALQVLCIRTSRCV